LRVGEATGSSTGQPLYVALPGGGSVRICTKHGQYPDGKEFVGVGIQPGVRVSPTIEDFRAGRDTVLDAAVHLLKK
jgi:C-terminal processing protease CtpA/Prc